jgi:hypothetical protein
MECSEVLKEYGLITVVGDNYAGAWPQERFRSNGVRYVRSDKAKSDIYLAFLPLLNSQRVELLDHARTSKQLLALERSKSSLGRETITHPKNGHDDLINSAAGALLLVARPQILEGYAATAPATAQPEQREGSVMIERVERHYSRCQSCGADHLVEKPGDEPLCPQRGWNFGPFGIGYRSGRRTFDQAPGR